MQNIVAAVLGLALGVVSASAGVENNRAVNHGLNQHDTWLRISAFTDVPLADADVAVYDTAGRLLFKQHEATNVQGVFPARVRALPQDFRVTVAWDGHRENDLHRRLLAGFTLSADVENFDPTHGIVYVNPVTTIVSRVLDRSRGRLTLEQAQALVRRFFGLPPNASLGAALREGTRFQSRYFSQKAFMAEAAQYWGVEPFLRVLLLEMLVQPEKAHSFAGAPLSSSSGGIGSWFAEKLAGAAVSWAGGQGCGWVAQSAGIITPGATEDDIANLQAGLADLQSSVDELSQQMSALTQQVQQVLTNQDKALYNQIVVPALALESQIDGVASELTFFAQSCPALTETGSTPIDPGTANWCTNEAASIKSDLNDVTIKFSYDTLSTYVLDNPTVASKGMIHLFSQWLGESVRFFRPADSTKIQGVFDYWDAALTQAANLKVELWHLNGAQSDPNGGVAMLTNFLGNANLTPPTPGTFQNTHDAASKLLFPPVPLDTVINTKDRKMWSTTAPNVGACLAPLYVPQSNSLTPYGPISYGGISGWVTPSVPDLQNLSNGFTGVLFDWLVAQTKTVDGESPESAGFPNILAPGFLCQSYWQTPITSSTPYNLNANPRTYGQFYMMDPYSGNIYVPSINQVGFTLNSYGGWMLLVRNLVSGEQYYWYP